MGTTTLLHDDDDELEYSGKNLECYFDVDNTQCLEYSVLSSIAIRFHFHVKSGEAESSACHVPQIKKSSIST